MQIDLATLRKIAAIRGLVSNEVSLQALAELAVADLPGDQAIGNLQRRL